MAEQGFRQPQFSEDSAWLPMWLQTNFLEGGEQPVNNNSTSKIECKALEGLLGSTKHGEDYGSELEMVRRQICPLLFSGSDCTATQMSRSIQNELDLHLSLSSEKDSETSSAKDSETSSAKVIDIPQEKQQFYVTLGNGISVEKENPEVTSDMTQNFQSCPEISNLKDMTEDPMSHNVLPEDKIVNVNIDDHTPCTELYIPGIIQDDSRHTVYGDGCGPAFFGTASPILCNNTGPSLECGTLNNATCAPGHTFVGSLQNSLKQQNRKRKSLNNSEGQMQDKVSVSELMEADIDTAIGLTVAAAEALVISDLIKSCRLSESTNSSEILEAAIKLKQARQMCGLDIFSGFTSGPMDGADDSLDDLDDDFMKDAFADVGLCVLEDTFSPIGLCSADVFEPEDAKRNTGKCSLSSASNEHDSLFEGRCVTPSKLELENGAFNDKRDDVVPTSAGTASLTRVSRYLTTFNNTKCQQTDSMGKAQNVVEHAGGSTINNGEITKPSKSGLLDDSITRKSENSPERNMSTTGLQNVTSTTYKKYDIPGSFQTISPSMEDLDHCSDKFAVDVVEFVAATPHCETNSSFMEALVHSSYKSANEAATICCKNGAVDKGMSCENEAVNYVESNMVCSPSWLHFTDNRDEESQAFAQSSAPLKWQNQFQAESSDTKESESAYNTQLTRSMESFRPFTSRWFGGWTGLEKEKEAKKRLDITMCVQKPFVDETSYLTESLDIDRGDAATAQSLSSQVLKLQLNNICPIPNMHIQDLGSINNEVCNSLSQIAERRSDSPVYDPLCSMVPCSIPHEDDAHIKRRDVKIHEGALNFSCKLHTDDSLQLHERLKCLQKVNIAHMCEQSEHHFEESEQVRTCTFGHESSARAKRKRVDSLRRYSTLSGVLQGGYVEILHETKEACRPRDSDFIHDSMEKLKTDCPSPDTVISSDGTKGVIKEAGPPKESVIHDTSERSRVACTSSLGVSGNPYYNREVVNKFSNIFLLESAPVVTGNHNGTTAEETLCKTQSMFQDQCRDACNVNGIDIGNLGDQKNISSICNPSGYHIELDDCFDVDEYSPLVFPCRKRRRLRASRIIETDSEDSKWDKVTSICMNESIAAVSDNVKLFEPPRNVPDLYLQKSHNHFCSERVDGKPIKRVHFSEDIAKPKAYTHKNYQDCLQKVRSDVSGSMNQFEALCGVQKAKMRKKIRDDYRKHKSGKDGQDLIFHGQEFLLTGLSTNKKNKLEQLIREHGGIVLSNIPLHSRIPLRGRCKTEHIGRTYPIILSSQQVRTTKFLYGCAAGCFLLQHSWIMDSITAKCCLPFDEYLLQSDASNARRWTKQNIFDTTVEHSAPLFRGIRVMLYGKPAFCSKLMVLIKHGGGLVFKTIKSLVQGCESSENASALIIVENVRVAPRHLRQCASEYRLPVMSRNWVIESLLLGRLLPFRINVSPGLQSLGKRCHFQSSFRKKPPDCQNISEAHATSSLGGENSGAADHGTRKSLTGSFSK